MSGHSRRRRDTWITSCKRSATRGHATRFPLLNYVVVQLQCRRGRPYLPESPFLNYMVVQPHSRQANRHNILNINTDIQSR